jgi:hypothetical protein
MEFQPLVHERGYRERDAEQNRLDYLRDEYYSFRISSANMIPTSASHTVVSSILTMYFTNGASQIADLAFIKPPLWRNGELRIEYYWAENGTDTGAFSITFDVYGVKNDSALGAKTTLNSSTETPSGSGTGFRLQKSSFQCSGTVLDEHKIISTRITRDGAGDANNDNFFILGVVFTFLPNNRQ